MPDNRVVTGLDTWTSERVEEFLEELDREAVPHAEPGKPFTTCGAVRAEHARRRFEQR
ncbi:MAG: hypothetical protein AAGC80_29220 [Rhodococcus sp. (in: high G+C Gram-positive bacteria)]